MPIFDIQHSDGRFFEVEAPDQQAALSAFQKFSAPTEPGVAAAGPSAWLSEGTSGDIAKTIPSAVARLGINTAGLPGDVGSLISAGADMAGIPAGLKSAATSIGRYIPVLGAMVGPSSEDIRKTVEGVTGPLYEPKTTLGGITDKAIQFAPGLLGGGANLATRAATNVALPAVAGQAIQEAGGGPIAQAAGEIGSSVLGHRLVTPRARGIPVPSEADLDQATNEAYARARAANVEIAPQAMSNIGHQMENALVADGKTTRNANPIFEAVRELQQPQMGATSTTRMTMQQIENLRSELSAGLTSPDGNIRRAARIARDALDDGLANNIRPQDVLRGNHQVAMQAFREGRGNAAAGFRNDVIAGKQALGDLNAGTAYAGQNVENTMRQSFKQLVRPNTKNRTIAEREGFNPTEVAGINQVARGDFLRNTLRGIGKLAPTDFGKMAGHAFAAGHTGGMSIPLSALSYGAKKASDALTNRDVRRLGELVRSRSPEGQMFRAAAIRAGVPQAALSTPQGLLAGLLAVQQGGLLGGLGAPAGLLQVP